MKQKIELIVDDDISLEGEVVDVIRMLQKIVDECKAEGIFNVAIATDYAWEQPVHTIIGDRYETDEEYADRLAAEKKYQEEEEVRRSAKDAKEYEKYLKLKEKYDK